MRPICVVYEETRGGRNALRYAADLAHALDSQLLVYVGLNDQADQDELARIQLAVAVKEEVQFQLVPYAGSAPPQLGSEAVLVLPRKAKPADEGDEVPPRLSESFAALCGALNGTVNFLVPADEIAVTKRGTGPILVPFSDGETGLVAATAAIELAQRLGAELIFYHTTWPDPTARSNEAMDQMCEEATRVMLAIESAASRAGVSFQTVVETHDDVVQGVIEIALLRRCSLVVMARGAQIRQGSYVGRTLQQSPVPVFVAKADTPFAATLANDAALRSFRYRRRQLMKKPEEQRIPLHRRLLALPILRSPMFVAVVVALAYIIKASSKIGVGTWINSPMITGDGFHNIADVLEVIAIGVVLFIAARQASDRYPFGRKNMEWFTQLGIGIGLFVAAGNFIVACVVGLLSYAPAVDHFARSIIPSLPLHEPVTMTAATFPWVLAVTALSFLMSLGLSRYQIMVGKSTGHASLIANGEEAASDGWIEAVTVVGVIAEFLTGWGFLEYVLGLVVAFMIARTAKELFMDGWRVLLQHSIGAEHEEKIEEACEAVRGVCGVRDLKTFQVGHTAVVMVTCESLAGGHGMTYIKTALEAAIRAYLVADDSDFKGAEVHVKMQRPDPRRHRVGYGLVNRNGVLGLAETVDEISHVAVCDVEHDDIVRSKVVPRGAKGVADVCVEKRIQRLHVFRLQESDNTTFASAVEELLTEADRGVIPQTKLAEARSSALPVLGLAV